MDLQAYVEDQLPMQRRIEVEAHLCRNPREAMRVIADLRVRDELRLAFADTSGMARIGTSDAARRLDRALGRDRLFRRLRRVAAMVALLGTGWLAHAEFGPSLVRDVAASTMPPPYVADALRSHRTALLRADMASQRQAHRLDAAEIRGATAIVVPDLPKDWTVRDVQIFPSSLGPSVEMTLDTGRLGTASLFAVRPGTFDVAAPKLADESDLSAAYWQIGDVAYALVAKGADAEIGAAAETLGQSLH
jgi:anti-sigma factor RsiW